MDKKTMSKLSYGLYIIGTKDRDRNVGCVVTTVSQATSDPVTVTLCVNKENYTNACIKKTGSFSVSILAQNFQINTLRIFGFSSSRDKDKFSNAPFALTASGLPYLKEGVLGYMQCKVIESVEDHTHTIFVAEVEEAEVLSGGEDVPPLTYAYYQDVYKGKSPKTASTYHEPLANNK